MANPAAQETSAPKLRAPTHTRPWLDREFIHIDGQALVYTHSNVTGITVRFPGGKAMSVDALRALGHQVVMPKLLRVAESA
jgi:type VI protein secretion system component VasK